MLEALPNPDENHQQTEAAKATYARQCSSWVGQGFVGHFVAIKGRFYTDPVDNFLAAVAAGTTQFDSRNFLVCRIETGEPRDDTFSEIGPGLSFGPGAPPRGTPDLGDHEKWL